MLVDIGGGTIPAAGYVNLDPAHGSGEFRRVIQDGIPVADSTLDGARASHLMEHVPAGAGDGERVWVMNEVHRALRPGGRFEIVVPCVPQGPGGVGWQAFADPTHVSFWVYPESFHYFDGTFAANADYGIRPWRTVESELREGWEARWVGEAVK